VALLPGVRARAAAGIARAPKPRETNREASPFLLAAVVAVAGRGAALLLPRGGVRRGEGPPFPPPPGEQPNSPHVHGILGGYYYRTRDLEQAAYHYRRAYELYPLSGEMLLNLVAAEDEMGRADSAFADAHLLNRRFPTYGPGWYALGN